MCEFVKKELSGDAAQLFRQETERLEASDLTLALTWCLQDNFVSEQLSVCDHPARGEGRDGDWYGGETETRDTCLPVVNGGVPGAGPGCELLEC